MRRARCGDVELAYEIRGGGPRLLFIGGTGWDLRRSPNAFDLGFPARFTTLAFDQRGMGRSDKPEGDCTMAGYGDDAARLLGAVGWERSRVIGYSFGGMVAQELALRHPGRVERLLLAGTTAGGAGGSSYPLHELQDLEPLERARRWVELSDGERSAAWRAANPGRWAALVELALAGFRLAEGEPGGVAGARRQLAARRLHDTWDRLPGLTVPVLVCGGRRDRIAPPEAVAALASRIPGAALRTFDGGHLFFLQEPLALEEMQAWLLGSTPPGPGGNHDSK